MRQTSNRMPIGRRRFERRVGLAWLLAAFLVAAIVPCARAAAATCTGKRVTIASNALKIVGTKAPDVILAGPGDNVIYGMGGNDTICGGEGPDMIEGGGDDDVLYGVNIFHPRRDSGPTQMSGGPGDDLLIGGQPCDGDLFDDGPGDNDSASFARMRNSGIFVKATIGGAVLDPDVAQCNAGQIEHSVEKIEGSPGRTRHPDRGRNAEHAAGPWWR